MICSSVSVFCASLHNHDPFFLFFFFKYKKIIIIDPELLSVLTSSPIELSHNLNLFGRVTTSNLLHSNREHLSPALLTNIISPRLAASAMHGPRTNLLFLLLAAVFVAAATQGGKGKKKELKHACFLPCLLFFVLVPLGVSRLFACLFLFAGAFSMCFTLETKTARILLFALCKPKIPHM